MLQLRLEERLGSKAGVARDTMYGALSVVHWCLLCDGRFTEHGSW